MANEKETIKVGILVSDFHVEGHIIHDVVTLELLNEEDEKIFYPIWEKDIKRREEQPHADIREFRPHPLLKDYTYGGLIRRWQTNHDSEEEITEEARTIIGMINDNVEGIELELVKTQMMFQGICTEYVDYISSTVLTVRDPVDCESASEYRNALEDLLGKDKDGKQDYLIIYEYDHFTAIIPHKLVPFVDVVNKLIPAMVEMADKNRIY